MKIALGIEYRGTGFNGWQIQPDCPSVQQALEDALETFLQVKTPTMCAGRTDTGVHAMQQVVSIETQADRPEAIRRIGVEWAVDQCRRLKAAGVPVIHFYTMGRAENVRQIIKEVF